MHRFILEFVQCVEETVLSFMMLMVLLPSLKQAHRGEYIANEIADCVGRYGIADRVSILCCTFVLLLID
jgi:hypothetical protein